MKYAITADLHLRADNADRLAYCDALCTLVQSQDIGNLIVAGDLFDQGYSGYKALDALLVRHSGLQVTVLPGNHDPDLAQGQFSSINIRVVTRPEVLAGDKGETGLVLLPYREGCTMGEALTEAKLETKKTGAWVLVSHGDFGTTARDLNGNESGYFPLTRRDITRYAFKRVILGHIHKPSSLDDEVLVPGSPWPIDSSERGPRRVLVLETLDGSVTSLGLGFSPCWLDWTIHLLPDGNEPARIKEALDHNFLHWERSQADGGQTGPVHVRVSVRGCTSRRSEPDRIVQQWFAGTPLQLAECTSDDLWFVETDSSLKLLTAEFEQALAELKLDPRQFPGDHNEMLDMIREYGLSYIYGLEE